MSSNQGSLDTFKATTGEDYETMEVIIIALINTLWLRYRYRVNNGELTKAL